MSQVTVHPSSSADTTGFNANFINRADAYSSNDQYSTVTSDANPRNDEYASLWGGFTGFSAIPDGSTINSIHLHIEYKVSAAWSLGEIRTSVWPDITASAALSPGTTGAFGPNNQYVASTSSGPTSDTDWDITLTGTLPTLAELKASNFGVRIQHAQGNDGGTFTTSIDDINFVVDYSPPAATVYAQAQTSIRITSRGYAQANAYISVRSFVHAQSQSEIEAQQKSKYAQALGQVGVTDNLYTAIDEASYDDTDYIVSPDTTDYVEFAIPADEPTYKQDHILRVRYIATNNVYIRLYQGTTPIAQTNVGNGLGWMTATLVLTPSEIANITNYSDLRVRLDSQTAGKRALVSWIQLQLPPSSGTRNKHAQAQATIYIQVTTYSGYAQAQALIRRTEQGFAQAQGHIIVRNINAYAQALGQVRRTEQSYAQSQAQIRRTEQSYAQAQAQLRQTYRGYAQAQTQIRQTYRGYGQAQAQIIVTYQSYGQAQTQIKATYRSYAQAQTEIRQTYQSYAQAQTQLSAAYLAYAQAMGQVKQTYQGYSQAQAVIRSTYQGYAQALAYIQITDIEGFAQAMAAIKVILYGHSQANAWIYLPQIARPSSDVYNADGWVGTVRD